MNESVTANPKLLKSRMRHTRFFIFALIPIIIFSIGVMSADSFSEELMDWTGYVLVIICVLGRAYCSAFIGGRKNDTVVDIGPFSVVRNPLYVFSFIGITGIALQSTMLTLLGFVLVTFFVYYPRVVAREEAFLLHKFGKPYSDYVARVPRWIPNFSLWKEPEEITLHPRFLRETMMDAALFFVAFPIFELIEELREVGMIPHYFILP